ncbi:MAG TPA: GNAT family N-acetyltransferase [Thermoanaerobaculia bacterium]|jgi:ribosomal protein S18 acetylase RimI-like enzyme|nr:GNAT family N-acetyltransferase [Thermoanaerobaculia bacterium]
MAHTRRTTIRRCKRDELTRVHELEIECFPKGALPLFAIVQYFDLFETTFFVALRSEDCVGFVIVGASSDTPNVAWLLDIAVSSAHRKQGIGRALMAAVIPVLCGRGVSGIRATVAPQNAASLALCTGLGFEIEREEPAYFGPNESRLLIRSAIG